MEVRLRRSRPRPPQAPAEPPRPRPSRHAWTQAGGGERFRVTRPPRRALQPPPQFQGATWTRPTPARSAADRPSARPHPGSGKVTRAHPAPGPRRSSRLLPPRPDWPRTRPRRALSAGAVLKRPARSRPVPSLFLARSPSLLPLASPLALPRPLSLSFSFLARSRLRAARQSRATRPPAKPGCGNGGTPGPPPLGEL